MAASSCALDLVGRPRTLRWSAARPSPSSSAPARGRASPATCRGSSSTKISWNVAADSGASSQDAGLRQRAALIRFGQRHQPLLVRIAVGDEPAVGGRPARSPRWPTRTRVDEAPQLFEREPADQPSLVVAAPIAPTDPWSAGRRRRGTRRRRERPASNDRRAPGAWRASRRCGWWRSCGRWRRAARARGTPETRARDW